MHGSRLSQTTWLVNNLSYISTLLAPPFPPPLPLLSLSGGKVQNTGLVLTQIKRTWMSIVATSRPNKRDVLFRWSYTNEFDDIINGKDVANYCIGQYRSTILYYWLDLNVREVLLLFYFYFYFYFFSFLFLFFFFCRSNRYMYICSFLIWTGIISLLES